MRERGGSFTLIALALAALILISAGLLTDASRNTLVRSAQEGRRSALREGVFGGVEWAATARSAPMSEKRLSCLAAQVGVSLCRISLRCFCQSSHAALNGSVLMFSGISMLSTPPPLGGMGGVSVGDEEREEEEAEGSSTLLVEGSWRS